jgi:hypothetical protein
MCIFEACREGAFPWLPVSLHHDGFAFIASTKDFDEDLRQVEESVNRRLSSTGLRPITLEVSPYNKLEVS